MNLFQIKLKKEVTEHNVEYKTIKVTGVYIKKYMHTHGDGGMEGSTNYKYLWRVAAMKFSHFALYTTALLESLEIYNIFVFICIIMEGRKRTTECEKKCQCHKYLKKIAHK